MKTTFFALMAFAGALMADVTIEPFVSVGPNSYSFFEYGTNLFTALDEGVSQRGKPGYPTHFKLAGTANAIVDGRYIIPTGKGAWSPGYYSWGPVVNTNTWGSAGYPNDTRKYLATGSLQPVEALISFIGFGYGGGPSWTNTNPVELHQRVMNNWRETMGVRFDLEFKGWTVSGTVSNEVSLTTSTHVTVVMAEPPPILYMRQNHYPSIKQTDTVLYWQMQTDEYVPEECNTDGVFWPIQYRTLYTYNMLYQIFVPSSTNGFRLFRLRKR